MTPALKQAQDRVAALEAQVVPIVTENVQLHAEVNVLRTLYGDLLTKILGKAAITKQ